MNGEIEAIHHKMYDSYKLKYCRYRLKLRWASAQTFFFTFVHNFKLIWFISFNLPTFDPPKGLLRGRSWFMCNIINFQQYKRLICNFFPIDYIVTVLCISLIYYIEDKWSWISRCKYEIATYLCQIWQM